MGRMRSCPLRGAGSGGRLAKGLSQATPWLFNRRTARLGFGVENGREELQPIDDGKSARSVIQDAIAAQDWRRWMQPQSNSSATIPAELRKILEANDEASSWQSVMYTEYAFGNAEAGTYYPAIIPAIPILAMIV
jgi:hypothetical protein